MYQPGPCAAPAPPLHLIPLILSNLRGPRRASPPYAAGDTTSTFAYTIDHMDDRHPATTPCHTKRLEWTAR